MSDYTPVSCELHDRLEATATLKKECSITYLNENNEPSEVRGRIVDVYSSDDGEWCKMTDDTVIRLDRIEKFEPD
ncbi:MAG: hypothetical protein QNJ53_03390 [Pleurocapsa sp. MO_192.B19]|nr:hypothetical protein [Pleurocapsa sp. MO_192.B19]MDJ0597064.1 hypothetical protein [Pleurocapsa sp. MO_226.B13]